MKVLTGIITFNPDMDRLKENLSAVTVQDTDILIYDNGSSNSAGIKNLASESGSKIVCMKTNQGIANGLRYIMDYALQHHYDWVLSLDQDSVTNKGLISEYKKYINNPKIGALTCDIRDRNFVEIDKEIFGNGEHGIQNVQKCITSGCFMRVSAYAATDGYDSRMFIDFVDFDICYALVRAGYKIVKIPYEGLLHEDGHGTNVTFFGRKYVMFHKSAWRRFYIVRNEIYMARKFPKMQSPLRTTLRCIYYIGLIFIYEDHKIAKLCNGTKGLVSGWKMRIHKG